MASAGAEAHTLKLKQRELLAKQAELEGKLGVHKDRVLSMLGVAGTHVEFVKEYHGIVAEMYVGLRTVWVFSPAHSRDYMHEPCAVHCLARQWRGVGTRPTLTNEGHSGLSARKCGRGISWWPHTHLCYEVFCIACILRPWSHHAPVGQLQTQSHASVRTSACFTRPHSTSTGV